MNKRTLLRWAPAFLSLMFAGYQGIVFLQLHTGETSSDHVTPAMPATGPSGSGERQLLAELEREEAELQSRLDSLRQTVHPDYESLLAQASAAAEQEFHQQHPAFAVAMQLQDGSVDSRTQLRAELEVMRYVMGPLVMMGLPQSVIDEWTPQLVEAERRWQEHVQQYRAGLITQLDPSIQQAQLVVREMMGERRIEGGGSKATEQSNEYGRIVTELTRATLQNQLHASTLNLSPELSDATRKLAVEKLQAAFLARPTMDQIRNSSDPRAVMAEHSRNQLRALREEFRNDYSGAEFAALERIMDEQDLQRDIADIANARREVQR